MIAKNLIKIYEQSFIQNWDLKALSDYSLTQTIYYKDLAYEIAKLHIVFRNLNINKGDRIALIGKNNIPWCTVYLAIMTYGTVVVPILQDFHADGVQHIINHSGAKLLFVTDSIWDTLDEDSLPYLQAAVSINNFDFNCLYDKSSNQFIKKQFQNIEILGNQKYPNGFYSTDIQYSEVDNSELILINYTSGTTGFSKGVMLTANNIAGNIVYGDYLKLLFRGDDILSFLPLAHAYGCAFEFLYSLSTGAHTVLLGRAPSPKILAEAFASVKPALVITVPLIIEKIYKKAILPVLAKSTVKTILKIPILRERIYAKFRKRLIDAFGGNFREVIIGGAALNDEVEKFLYQIKFPFTVGYGMTECAPLITYDHYYDFIPTSCGRILDNIMSVRIDSQDQYHIPGEIQVKGENVMMGYYKNPEATEKSFTKDGWLRTGDIGTIDINNRVYIRGRSKTMILSANGQNIFPEEIESRLNNMAYVAESLVVQRGHKLVALVYPDYEMIDRDQLEQEQFKLIMEDNRTRLNKGLASYESIADIQIYPSEFEKTPKKSIKRYLYVN